jgi:hypothetical protein
MSEASGGRALFGWSPPARPPSIRLQRVVDRVFPRSGVGCALYIMAVVALLSLARHLRIRAYLAADGLAAWAAGSWCLANFWRCRQAHCLIDGTGWLILALLAFAEVGLGRSVIGGSEQAVFVGLLVVAVVFEFAWRATHATNAIIGRDQRLGRGHASI